MKRVYLEITNACNLNCPFCTNEKGNQFLTIQEINNYLDQIKPYCNYIYLHILGEPMLHPNFDEILNLLDQKEFDLQLVSNGTLLYRYPNLLSHSCLRKLSISLHSINRLPFKDSYFLTLQSLIDSTHNANIELRFYDIEHLDRDLKDFFEQLKKEYGFEYTSKKNSYKLKEHTYLYIENLFAWPNINDPIVSYQGKCHGGIDMIAINSSGEVTLCCLDPKAYNTLGNLKKQTLKEILESDNYQYILEQFKKHIIVKDLCARCTYRNRFTLNGKDN